MSRGWEPHATFRCFAVADVGSRLAALPARRWAKAASQVSLVASGCRGGYVDADRAEGAVWWVEPAVMPEAPIHL
jgi:hypothetical protein